MEINLTAVLVAGVAAMVIGFVWYSPGVFGKKWARLTGISMDGDTSGMAPRMLAGLISMIVMAYVLAYLMAGTGMTDVKGGVTLAFKAWLGFNATVLLGSVLWEKKSVELYVLNTAHWLVAMLLMGAVIGWM